MGQLRCVIEEQFAKSSIITTMTKYILSEDHFMHYCLASFDELKMLFDARISSKEERGFVGNGLIVSNTRDSSVNNHMNDLF